MQSASTEPEIDFIEQSTQPENSGDPSGLNLMQLVDQLPVRQPPFWRLMAKYRCFWTSMQYLISLSQILAKRFPKYFPEFQNKNRMELYDVIMTKLL